MACTHFQAETSDPRPPFFGAVLPHNITHHVFSTPASPNFPHPPPPPHPHLPPPPPPNTAVLTPSRVVGPEPAPRTGDGALVRGADFPPLPPAAAAAFAGAPSSAGYGMAEASHGYDDYAGLDVKGKIVLAMRFEPHDEKGHSR